MTTLYAVPDDHAQLATVDGDEADDAAGMAEVGNPHAPRKVSAGDKRRERSRLV